jgi:hypothetical protein
MKQTRMIRAMAIVLAMLASAITLDAQSGAVAKLARELIEQVAKKGGKEAAEELARMGGETAVKEVLEKAAREGGEELAQKVTRYATEYGAAVVEGARVSPAKFITAFEGLQPAVRQGALQAIRREPEMMSALVADFGQDALVIGARHPGVGPQLLRKLGPQGAGLLQELSTDQAIQLGRLSKGIAAAGVSQRSELLALIRQAPGRVLDILERHPRILATTAALGAFLAVKDKFLGGSEVVLDKDGKPVVVTHTGVAERVVKVFQQPLTAILLVVGAALAFWAAIRLWAVFRLNRLRVAEAEKRAETKRNVAGTPH